jgi:hypothetical protein
MTMKKYYFLGFLLLFISTISMLPGTVYGQINDNDDVQISKKIMIHNMELTSMVVLQILFLGMIKIMME